MANVTHNPKLKSNYPAKANRREARLSSHNHSAAVTDGDFTVEADDGIDFVRNTGANDITLPAAAQSKGRKITLLQASAHTMTVAASDGADIDGGASFTALDAADDWCTLFCTGEEWIIVAQSIA